MRSAATDVLAALCLACALAAASCTPRAAAGLGGQAANRIVVDMRGVPVSVPAVVSRVATIDDGFVESVMSRLGTLRTLVAVSSPTQQKTWSYVFPGADGRSYAVSEGLGTVRALNPWMAGLPCAGVASGDAVNYETIAGARPDVVIVRVGDCTLGTSSDAVSRTTSVLESMGIPAVVLRSPADFRGRGLRTLREEILVLGRLFGREDDAAKLAEELSATESFVRSRVSAVPEISRPRALYLGLSSGARASGGAAYAWGRDTAESWMLEQVVGARNAYEGPGSRVLLNAEQVLALDPDVIFLPTNAGYHPPRELYEAPYFGDLQHLRAVRQRRVYALPWSPGNCARRLEYPIDLMIMAKGAFPERFADVAVHQWVLGFYRQTYAVDDAAARLLRRSQWLEWTEASGF
jgi:iron complex transport system substrate-binding protein